MSDSHSVIDAVWQIEFRPLDQPVPVYTKPFRLVQAMAAGLARNTASLNGMETVTITGTLEDQQPSAG